jgi:hypothetical protein
MNSEIRVQVQTPQQQVVDLELLCAIMRQQLDQKNLLVSEMRKTIANLRVSNSELLAELSKKK